MAIKTGAPGNPPDSTENMLTAGKAKYRYFSGIQKKKTKKEVYEQYKFNRTTE
jgi:hypothetical protein